MPTRAFWYSNSLGVDHRGHGGVDCPEDAFREMIPKAPSATLYIVNVRDFHDRSWRSTDMHPRGLGVIAVSM